jgi:hypothetical protein
MLLEHLVLVFPLIGDKQRKQASIPGYDELGTTWSPEISGIKHDQEVSYILSVDRPTCQDK